MTEVFGTRWRSMETAPTDGSDILLCKMDGNATAHPAPYIGWYHSTEKEWVNTYSGKGQYPPSHWMPLPTTPLSNGER